MSYVVVVADRIADAGFELLRAESELEVRAIAGQPDRLPDALRTAHALIVRSDTTVTEELMAAGPGRLYHEATVGAGLPVVRTLADQLATGDQLARAEGVLSGTASFLMSELARGERFSDAVRRARAGQAAVVLGMLFEQARGIPAQRQPDALELPRLARRELCVEDQLQLGEHVLSVPSDVHHAERAPALQRSPAVGGR